MGLALLGVACTSEAALDAEFRGSVKLDGSSTVYPISEAVASEARDTVYPGMRVTIGISGTGGGFRKFCDGERDINDASRPIKPSEIELCAENGISYIELPVAFDGISVVINPANSAVDSLTVEELREIWKPDTPVETWQDVRPDWPDLEIHRYGPAPRSGTFDYFTEAINGDTGLITTNFSPSEDDNLLVSGVKGEDGGIAFFGYAYYVGSIGKIKAVAIDNGSGPVMPTPETINNGSYQPLSRPVFIYVNVDSANTSQSVEAFVEYYLDRVPELAPAVDYIALPDDLLENVRERFRRRITGSAYQGSSGTGAKKNLTELYRLEPES